MPTDDGPAREKTESNLDSASREPIKSRKNLIPMDGSFYLIEREKNELPAKHFDKFDIK
jgi:hypothetical protein